MKPDQLLDLAIQIQSIPAPTFQEVKRAEFMKQALTSRGLKSIEIDEVGNVYGVLPGNSARPVVVSAHLDSVFPQETDLKITSNGSRVMGPGIGDNAIALASLAALADEFSQTPLPGDLWMVANVGEEGLGDLRGMRHVVKRFGDHPAAYIVLEGMALGHVYHRALPVRRFRLSIRTSGGHSWIHHRRRSALHTAIEITNEILGIKLPPKPKSTLNIGTIQGGTSVNTIASETSLELEVRSEDQKVLDQITREIERRIKAYPGTDFEIGLQTVGQRPGGDLDANHPLVLAAKRAYEAVGTPDGQPEFASTDANLPLSLNLPAVCVGITYGGGAHSVNEFIEVEPIQTGLASLSRLVRQIFMLELEKETSSTLS